MPSCSNSFMCPEKQYMALFILTIIVFAVYFMRKSEENIATIKRDLDKTNERLVRYAIDNRGESERVSTNMFNLEHDYQRVVNPLVAPERSYPYRPLRAGLPININTRGPSSGFQQMGFLTETGVDPSGNKENKLLPLYGEQTYPGSNQYRYYTSSDGFQSVKLPVNNKNKDCMDEYGCDEIYDGDNINVNGYNKSYKAQLYKIDRPRYNPYVI